MKFRYALIAFLGLFSLSINGQITPPTSTCLGNNLNVCVGQLAIINNCPNGSGSGVFMNAPNPITLSDDNWSAPINIGFPFSFYGNTYTQCVAGSNGIVSFNTSLAGGACAWALNGTPLPNAAPASALNTAMICYQDLNPANATSGPVQFQTIGTAPNRKFVVLYNGVTMFSCTQSCAYISMIFHETTNVIEYHIGYKGQCSTWNGGRAIQGTENASGTVAHMTPGRNNTIWNASQDGQRWTPTSSTNTTSYSVMQIPYINVSAPGGGLMWKSTLGQTFPYNNGQLIVNQVPPGTTGYFLIGTSCGVPVGSVSDTTLITRTSATLTASANPAICGTNTGTVTAVPGNGTAPFSFNWPVISQQGATINNLPPGTYSVTMTDANGCLANASATVTNIPATFSADSNVVSCVGGSDGQATAYMSPLGLNTTYLWNDVNNQTTQTASGLSSGIYTCTISSDNGCTGFVTIEVTEIEGLVVNIANKVNVTCHSLNDGIISLVVSNGTPPYAYAWSGSTQTTATANDLFAGQQDVIVTDQNNCPVNITTVLSEPDALQITSISPDTMICSEDAITLSAVGSGGSTTYTFLWLENNAPIGTGSSILVDPSNTNTTYRAILSETCGSPIATDSTFIVFPTEIVPNFTPDKLQGCAPEEFTFYNNSSNLTEIFSTMYNYSNGNFVLADGSDSSTMLFDVPGKYTLDVLITSIYGCVYQETFTDIIDASARPIARLAMSANPTTIFETRIAMSDKSSSAVAWEWNVPDATPSLSTLQNPVFNFPQKENFYPVQLKVTSAEGCTDSVTAFIEVKSDMILYVPNAFTPDGDQHNNTWKFHSAGIEEKDFIIKIFDRWGTVVWVSNDLHAEWDGTYKGQILPTGTYNWQARYREEGKQNPRIKSGSILLLR